ncbi:hypothetical protein JGUZn3_07960 [Entomobacter blattae]|uniref:Uncharacterized protein n=1 Tax=Entomobacter blattae TaxID=2762277 RepID=A0A7H1NQG9_9PROT|nr:hypothetical protein JGUZn3_07960 [Entomobacter blattae]
MLGGKGFSFHLLYHSVLVSFSHFTEIKTYSHGGGSHEGGTWSLHHKLQHSRYKYETSRKGEGLKPYSLAHIPWKGIKGIKGTLFYSCKDFALIKEHHYLLLQGCPYRVALARGWLVILTRGQKDCSNFFLLIY